MGLSFRNIKRWTLMIFGKSIYHVNQNLGKHFNPEELKGYFNNLTEKVTKADKKLLEKGSLPLLETNKNEKIIFPVAVLQYALGCYDLFLSTGNQLYRDKFLELSDWAVEKQEESGGWNNFWYIYPDHPYGAMCQGEAASVLVRAFRETNNSSYLLAAKKALNFIFLERSDANLFKEVDDELILLEYENKPAVLNGWIFAAFGFYDVWLETKDVKYLSIFNKTIKTIEKYLSRFDNGYWSMYDLDGRIASPFYHKLHISQLEALYLTTNSDIFLKYQNKFIKYNKNPFKRLRAFIKKANQKIKE